VRRVEIPKPDGGVRKLGRKPETCPVRAMRAWLEGAAIDSGPVFRSVNRHGKLGARMSGYAVALVAKRYAGAVGREPRGYSGHSLRAGLATSAAIAGASERAIMNQTGHRSAAMVRRYIRDGNLFRGNVAAKVGCRSSQCGAGFSSIALVF
jgi:integrase